MANLDRQTLVLNATYEPINVCAARRAMTLMTKGKAIEEARSAYTIRTPHSTVHVPSVIRLKEYRRVPRFNRQVSPKGIKLRDGNTCQYCGKPMKSADLTLDHVIPRSRGGESTWENLVASCFTCNNRKGNQTPDEAEMPLLKRPVQINIHSKHKLLAGDDNHQWDKFLFY